MSETIFDRIQVSTKALNIDPYASGLAAYVDEEKLSAESLEAVCKVLEFLQQKKYESIVNTLLRMSRLPLKEPKTFDGFDFGHVRGKQVEHLKNLPSLAALYAHRNLAFIGPQGVGKTHLAMAYGRECCKKGMKAYFLKATELNQKFMDAIKYGREGSAINGLVKPSCLIIDEIGRCVFNRDATRMFFDMVDRRYNKDGPNTMIFTSNVSPDKWGEFFSEDSSLLCALDRIFDNATVFMMKGNSYRGKKLETIAIETGRQPVLATQK
ncbi:MAG: ATP-binding protein [Bacteroidales bacterium]|nr:ATP-binding protein [Bacteroidales bacterium]